MLIELVNEPSEIIVHIVLQKKFTIEGHLAWLSFPGLIRALALLQGLFFVVLILNPAALEIVRPDWELVKTGQVWRLFAFVLLPPVMPGSGGLVFPVLFMLISIRLLFLFGDVLEQAWGPTRTSIYVYLTIICQGVVMNFHPLPFAYGGYMYYLAIFFAFATIVPNYVFMLMFILPVKVWILAAFTGVMMLLSCLSAWFLLFDYTVSFLPYLVWAIPKFFRWKRTRHQVAVRRNKFQSAQATPANTFHCCASCQRTEASDPDLGFRIAEDGEEYCLDHLP